MHQYPSFLSVDAVQKADSGHPGLPLGAAPMAYVLWTRFLKHHPANPAWMDREVTWLEGVLLVGVYVLLVGVYVLLGLAFFFSVPIA